LKDQGLAKGEEFIDSLPMASMRRLKEMEIEMSPMAIHSTNGRGRRTKNQSDDMRLAGVIVISFFSAVTISRVSLCRGATGKWCSCRMRVVLSRATARA
jgi:hypothetical protein